MKYLLIALFLFVSLTSAKKGSRTNNEILRPQFHFSPQKNSLYQPAGLLFLNGKYHFFYNQLATTPDGQSLTVEHAVSNDLISWKYEAPVAEALPLKVLTNRNVTSGSAVVDLNNVAGLQSGSVPTMLIFRTNSNGEQEILFSTDEGATWKKLADGLAISGMQQGSLSPKVTFDPTGKRWIMTLFHPGSSRLYLYSSVNLLKWELISALSDITTPAQLVSLPDSRDARRWVLVLEDGTASVGAFDGKVFRPEGEPVLLDLGTNFSSPQFVDYAGTGDVAMMGWLKGGEYPDMPFEGQMCIPTTLKIKEINGLPQVCRQPLASLSALYADVDVKEGKNIYPGIKGNLLSGVKGEMIHIKAEINVKTSDSFGVVFRVGKNSNGAEMRYETAKNIVEVNGARITTKPVEGVVKFELLIDRSTIELFVNDGEIVHSSTFNPSPNCENVILYTQGGEIFVNKITASTLKSIWENQ